MFGSEGKAVIGVDPLPKNSIEQYRFTIEEYKGRSYADLRIYYLNSTTDEWKPSRKGLTISPALWGEFVKRIEELDAQLRAQGLLVEVEAEAEAEG